MKWKSLDHCDLGGNEKVFIYFAAFKNHIGIYPPVKDKALKKKLKVYANKEGNLSFPLDEEIPLKLIGEIANTLHAEIT